MASFTLGGTVAKTVLLRAVGPTLATFGVAGGIMDPKLELIQRASLLQSNDNWGTDDRIASAAAKVGAFAFDGSSRDAAVLVTLSPGSYTAQVSGVGNTAGVALLEIYELP